MNMMPFFTGKVAHSPRTEYGYFVNQFEAIREGEWKLRKVNGDTELFNMQHDPDELYNEAKDHPDLIKQLQEKMDSLAKDIGVKAPGEK